MKIALLVGAAVSTIYFSNFYVSSPQETPIGRLEGYALDLKTRLRDELVPSGNVVVVAIDEASLARFGRWPWPRGVMADLLEGLTEAGARVIALDMVFTEEVRNEGRGVLVEALRRYRSLENPGIDENDDGEDDFERWVAGELERVDDDQRLARAIFESGRVVWGLFAHDDAAIAPPPELTGPAFESVGPFMVEGLYKEGTGGRDPVDEVPASSPNLQVFEIAGGIEAPLPIFSAATPFFGFVNLELDDDGVLRRADVVGRHEGVLIPSLALSSVAAWLGSRIYPIRDPDRPDVFLKVQLKVGSAANPGTLIRDDFGAVDWVRSRADHLLAGPWESDHQARFESWKARVSQDRSFDVDKITLPGLSFGDQIEVPLDSWQRGRLMINHIGKARSFDVVSAVDVIEGRADAEDIAGRIALVGVTAMGTYDQRVTPFDRMLPGVFVQASIMDSMITGRHLRRPWGIVLFESLLPLLIGLFVGLVMPRLSKGRHIFGFVISGAILIFGVSYAVFFFLFLQIATFTPLATFLLACSTLAAYQWVVVDKEKRYVRRAFQHYLAPSVLESVLKDPKKLALQPNKGELSVLFSDIRGFTSISERLSPEELATMLNQYLSPMTRVIFEHGGTLDKYMGDAVMAFWNDPIPQADHALLACKAGLAMQQTCDELNSRFEARGWPKIDIGVGINTGIMSMGNFGSDVLFDYTVMGDAVNLASRLEGANKQYGTGIIISEFTYAMVKGSVFARELDSVRVKGRNEPVRLFELLGDGEADEEIGPFLKLFSGGISSYKAQRWDEAEEAFIEYSRLQPEDLAAKLYIERCRAMRETPPGDEWDGVFTMQSK